ncbi:MAG: hypothetical protein HUK04_00305 [Bacteroidaceae bacterium]|nr:hypothetical protein [Bacteroidaceae bacterium]
MIKNEQLTAKSKKTRQKKPQPPKTDLFTTLCKSDLRVECIKEHTFHPERRWRFDYAIPTYRIAIEVEGGVWTGGRHTRPQGFLGDIEKYNTATLMGWRVVRCVPETLHTTAMLNLVRDLIRTTPTYTEAQQNDTNRPTSDYNVNIKR